jgi:nucleolar complex protein 2
MTSIARHREELEDLRERDPDFFKFLQENDAGLLNFDDSDAEEDVAGSSDEDADEDEDDDGDVEDDDGSLVGDEDGHEEEEDGPRAVVDVTEDLVASTLKRATSGSLSALKQLMAIFRAACIPAGSEKDSASLSRYSVSSPELYDFVMTRVIENSHKAFYSVLNLTRGKLSREIVSKIESHEKWKKIQALVLSFFKSVLHILSSLATTHQNREVVVYLVSGIESYIPLLAPMPRLTKAVLKALLTLWCDGPSPQEDATHSRGHCFLRMRQMAILLPGTVAEDVFKGMYTTFAKNCKSYSETVEPSIMFMIQCISELFQTDVALAYQQGFVFIRQMALHLRGAYVKKTPDALKQIQNWQFLNCLRVWTRVVCSMPETNALGPLVFPLSQLMLGLLALSTSASFIPLRFHLISLLQLVAAHAQVFIPLAPRIREVLDMHDLVSKPTPSTELAPKLQYLIKFPAGAASKPAVRDAIVQEVVSFLRQDAEIYRYHVGAPEYLYLSIRKLRAYCKQCKISKWRDLLKILISQLDEISLNAKKTRIRLSKSPMEITDFEPLKSITEPVSSKRLIRLMSSKSSKTDNIDEIVVDSEAFVQGKQRPPSSSAESWKLATSGGQVKVSSGGDSESSSEEDDEEASAPRQIGKKRASTSGDSMVTRKEGKNVHSNRKKKARVDSDAFDEPDQLGSLTAWSDED